jgi:streptomycin 6-kinase
MWIFVKAWVRRLRSKPFGHSASGCRSVSCVGVMAGLDRERARLWALAQTVAWSIGDYFGQHVETARWLLELAKH